MPQNFVKRKIFVKIGIMKIKKSQTQTDTERRWLISGWSFVCGGWTEGCVHSPSTLLTAGQPMRLPLRVRFNYYNLYRYFWTLCAGRLEQCDLVFSRSGVACWKGQLRCIWQRIRSLHPDGFITLSGVTLFHFHLNSDLH